MNATVLLAQTATDALGEITARGDALAIARRLRALQTFPEMGSRYEPDYPAAKPDHDVLVTYAGHYGIYYVYDPVLHGGTVFIEWIQDERRDPTRRFES